MDRETVGTRPYTSIYDIETTGSTRMTVTYPPDTDATGGTTSFTLPHVDDIVADRLHLPPPFQFFTFTLGAIGERVYVMIPMNIVMEYVPTTPTLLWRGPERDSLDLLILSILTSLE